MAHCQAESFNRAILYAICDAQVVDLDDVATPMMKHHISTALNARILLNKARACDVGPGDDVPIHQPTAIILQVSRALGSSSLLDASSQSALDSATATTTAAAARDFQLAKAFSYHFRPWVEPTINSPSVRAQNMLSGAIVVGNLTLVTSLLEQAPLPSAKLLNTKSPFFGYPLQLAAAWGHVGIVRHLLRCGANPHLLGRDDHTVCEDFLWRKPDRLGHYEYIELPSRHRLDRCSIGSALRVAVLGGHDDIVSLLLEPEYCISTDTNEYVATLLSVSSHGRVDMLQRLIQATGRDILEDIPWLGEELLRRAAYYQQTSFVEWLLDRGTNLTPVHSMRFYQMPYALSSACGQGNLPLARLLLSRGAHAGFHHVLNRHNPSDPIELAARHGHLDAVQLLVKHGAPVLPALAEAAGNGQAHVVAWLCKTDRNVVWLPHSPHVDGPAGSAALLSAIHGLNRPIIQILVEAGISLDKAYGADKESAMFYAKRHGGPIKTKLLVSLGAKNIELPEEEIEHNDSFYHNRGGLYITEHTWEWAGKY